MPHDLSLQPFHKTDQAAPGLEELGVHARDVELAQVEPGARVPATMPQDSGRRIALADVS